MKSIVSGAFGAAAILVFFPCGTIAASSPVPTPMQTAQSGGADIPQKCIHLTDPGERAACIRESMERQQRG